MRKLTLLVLAVAATVLAAACSNNAPGNLIDRSWQLTAITEKVPAFQGVIPPADQSKYTVIFNKDGTFNAVADCNIVAGTYKTSGSDRLTMTLGPSTLAYCGPGSFGDLFAHALSRAASYAIAEGTLTITLNDGGTLTFVGAGQPGPTASAGAVATSAPATPTPTAKPTPTPSPSPSPTPAPTPTPTPTAKPTTGPTTAPTATPAPTPPPTPAPTATPAPTPPPSGLTGRTWLLTAITEKVPAFQGLVPEAQQQNYTATFNPDGTFQAKADCNNLSGTYTSTPAGGLTLVIGPSTLVACPDGSFSDLYVLGLSNAASYAIANNALTITLADQGTLVYR